MPWKAFMQSSALTNSDNQLANELFMQRENAHVACHIFPCKAAISHNRI